MIAPDHEFDGAPRLRGVTELEAGHGGVESAELLVSALGVYEAWVNGHRISEDLLAPGWTSYEWRIRYETHDVTSLVGEQIVIGVALGNGWYRGRLGWLGDRALYGDELAAIVQLRVRFADGHEQMFGTDDSWRSGPSAVTRNDLYDGQAIDARVDDTEWLGAGFDVSGWAGVHALDFEVDRLQPSRTPAICRQEHRPAVRTWRSPSGRLLIDFGQNVVGWLRLRVRGSAGEVIRVRHAEVLDGGELGVRPLRSALATDEYTLSGGRDVFEPTFTFHGFRYAEIEGWPGGDEEVLQEEAVAAVVIGSDLRRIGRFRSSHELLNRLHENAVWGVRGNFVGLPTDCPQRDERLGWTGDIAVFAPSAAFLFDAGAFLADWLRDLALEQQHNDGTVPVVVPDAMKHFASPDTPALVPTAIWGDAAVWVPWALWTAYGDRRVLQEQFTSMVTHARAVRALLSPTGLWDQGFQLGDWLDPDAPPDDPFRAKADPGVVATACAYRTASEVAAAAAVLGKAGEADEFTAMATGLRAAFRRDYLQGDGRITSDCATVYALAIEFGLLEEPERLLAGERLAEVVEAADYRISTGFAGTPYVTGALSSTGHVEHAYRLLLQTDGPSWLNTVEMGATTIWERWDSMLPDGRINPGEMTSFNHYALGAVVDWMHRSVAGIAPLEPGYRRILIAPQPGPGLDWAEASLASPHGPIDARWSIESGQLSVACTIPDGCTAVLRIPGREDEPIASGRHTRSIAWTAATPARHR